MKSRQIFGLFRLHLVTMPLGFWLVGLFAPVAFIGVSLATGKPVSMSSFGVMLGALSVSVAKYGWKRKESGETELLAREFLWTRAVDRAAVFWSQFAMSLFLLAYLLIPGLATILVLRIGANPENWAADACVAVWNVLITVAVTLILVWVFLLERRKRGGRRALVLVVAGWCLAFVLCFVVAALYFRAREWRAAGLAAWTLFIAVYLASAVSTVWDARRMYLKAD